jgi:quinol monooxygenase YgiN
VARSLTDPDAYVVVEVFEDLDAFDRQNTQREVAAVLALARDGALIGDLEFSRWEAPDGG